MKKRLAFTGIALLGLVVSQFSAPLSATEVIAQTSTPTPPPVIPAWILGGGNFYGGQQEGGTYNDVDPGPSPDQRLFAGVLDASATADSTLGTNCPGIGSGATNVSNCNPYLYINTLDVLCDGSLLSTPLYSYINNGSHETAFVHYYASPIPTPTASPGPRVSNAGECSSPDVSPPLTPSPYPSAGYYTNPDDSGFLSWLLGHAWTTAAFPTPYGIYEDHFAVVGDAPCFYSYEYGDQACNTQGNSNAPQPVDWETALGKFQTNAEANCGTTCFASWVTV